MSWTSKYAALFTKALKWQMFAIINRDMQSALDFVSGTPGSLPSFVSYHSAAVGLEQFPSLLLTTLGQRHSRDRGANYREYEATYYAALAVAHQDRSVVADMTENYVRALDAVLITAWEATVGDFYSNSLPMPSGLSGAPSSSVGCQAGSILAMHIDEAVYDDTRKLANQKGFAQAAVMKIVFEMLEV